LRFLVCRLYQPLGDDPHIPLFGRRQLAEHVAVSCAYPYLSLIVVVGGHSFPFSLAMR
jgi:hypothetical protein